MAIGSIGGAVSDATIGKIESVAKSAIEGVKAAGNEVANVGKDAVRGVENAGKAAFNSIMEIPLVKWIKVASDWWDANVAPKLKKLGRFGKLIATVVCGLIVLVAIYQISGPVIWAVKLMTWLARNLVEAWRKAFAATKNAVVDGANAVVNGANAVVNAAAVNATKAAKAV